MAPMSTTAAPAPPATATGGARPGRVSHGAGFWLVAFAFLTVMAYSAVPTPLYAIYAARDGFGPVTITLVFAVYAVGVVAALVGAGHLSDHHGRRVVLVRALLLSVLSAGIFLAWKDLAGLVVARFLNGLAVGAVAATATAWLAELSAADGGRARRAEVVGIAANIGGIGVGPLVAGALAQWVDAPLTVPYVVFAVLLLLAAVATAVTPETRWVAPELRPAYRPQRTQVPAGATAAFAGALATAAIAFAAFGLFTSLAPAFLAGPLGHPSHALAGLAAFLVFGGAAASQVAVARWSGDRLVRVGTAGLVLGAAGITGAVWLSAPSLGLFLVGGLVLGAGSGALFKGALATIVRISDPERRAGTLVSLFLAGYLGLTVPVVGLGLLSQVVELRTALLLFSAVLVAAMLASLRPLLRASR